MTTPPMPYQRALEPVSSLLTRTRAWGRAGWAEAERLEAELARYKIAPDCLPGWVPASELREVEAERDEARARVAELEAARETDQERMDAVNEVQALRAQVAELKDAKDTAARFDAFLTRMEEIFPEAEDRTQLLGCAAETKAQVWELAEALGALSNMIEAELPVSWTTRIPWVTARAALARVKERE